MRLFTCSTRLLLAGFFVFASRGWLCLSYAGEGSNVAGERSTARFARERFVAGRVKSAEGYNVYAGVEIDMQPGWKTYWRNPGDAGGVPPEFVWEGSSNLKRATVLYPAPERLVDKSGQSIGYKERVTFPILIEPKDPALPVKVNLTLNYGLCQDICIPVSVTLAGDIAPGEKLEPASGDLAAALRSVPTKTDGAGGTGPRLVNSRFELSGRSPKLQIDVHFAAGDKSADAFVEAPAGYYVPMLQKVSEDRNGVVVFEADLSDGIDLEDLNGQTLRLTLVGRDGARETNIVVR